MVVATHSIQNRTSRPRIFSSAAVNCSVFGLRWVQEHRPRPSGPSRCVEIPPTQELKRSCHTSRQRLSLPSCGQAGPAGGLDCSLKRTASSKSLRRRRSQVAKAADCKSAIPGSNPGGASLDFDHRGTEVSEVRGSNWACSQRVLNVHGHGLSSTPSLRRDLARRRLGFTEGFAEVGQASGRMPARQSSPCSCIKDSLRV